MSTGTRIEWTEATWNPATGCDRVSAGCDNCYALTLARRLKAMGSPKYQADGNPATSGPGFAVTVHPDALDEPLRWRRPRRVFVNSMGDLFHPRVPDEFIAKVFAVMARTPQHTYQVLTKRHDRLRALLSRAAFRETAAPGTAWPLPNVWVGVSVEDQHWAEIRVPALLATPAAVRFVSCEPLLGPVDLTRIPYQGDRDYVLDALDGRYGEREPRTLFSAGLAGLGQIDWVIAGGESGPGARPMHPAWARSLRDQCTNTRRPVPFFFKQWGGWAPSGYVGIGNTQPNHVLIGDPVDDLGHREKLVRVGKKAAGRELDGRTWDEYPNR
ncbi:DUF5131 family protein [Kitasatospora aureofaciens]|uniref:Phage Gp37/Gp68 family protein n=1 Tax=Kitasatospora aureofaciens TaxID=1894 RepID=A0A1E7NEV9_KITAU|nr:phage Gp37/Gp68 family protein [Kitasatospora aureofaciens]ARF83254.1 hypothetical protein B6264_30405 [Kitasatospora aureofaciens]OEV39023.1 hypothetical protein HS99_0018135 [Kitasatospora aureofaciens]GGV03554.1 hypothetical protein GCM10010502_67730 [Kitasatospora aureofaciens]